MTTDPDGSLTAVPARDRGLPPTRESAVTEVDQPDEVAAPTRETGHTAVDEVLRRLDDLETLPVSEHVAVFEEVLTGLRSALAGAGEPADTSA